MLLGITKSEFEAAEKLDCIPSLRWIRSEYLDLILVLDCIFSRLLVALRKNS